MKTIKRKSMLYQTGVEYGDYTMNHVHGCAHGCKYPCYAFLMKKRFGQIKDYESWLEPVLGSNTLELLEAVSFTDRIIFGRTNYSKVANAYEGHKHFYNECAAEVVSFCQEHGIDYHIKEKTITEE